MSEETSVDLSLGPDLCPKPVPLPRKGSSPDRAQRGGYKTTELCSLLFSNPDASRPTLGPELEAYISTLHLPPICLPWIGLARFFMHEAFGMKIVAYLPEVQKFLESRTEAHNLFLNIKKALFDEATIIELATMGWLSGAILTPAMAVLRKTKGVIAASKFYKQMEQFMHEPAVRLIEEKKTLASVLWPGGEPAEEGGAEEGKKKTGEFHKCCDLLLEKLKGKWKERVVRLASFALSRGRQSLLKLTADFAEGGRYAAIDEEWTRVLNGIMQPTNDCSESCFGILKQYVRRHPNATHNTAESVIMYRVNVGEMPEETIHKNNPKSIALIHKLAREDRERTTKAKDKELLGKHTLEKMKKMAEEKAACFDAQVGSHDRFGPIS